MSSPRRTSLVSLALGAILALAVPASAQTYKICIDPGHGGSDPGATGGGQTEAANVLDTGLKFRDWMNVDTGDTAGGGSWNVIMTRTTDATVSLSGRTTFANSNSANRFMSIHNNAASSTAATGIETFSVSSTGTAADLRNKVQQEALLQWPLTNRGNKTANYYVIVNTSMAAELHEMAFITNTNDRVYLGSSTHRNNHAKSELFAIQRHMGFAKYTPGAAVTVIGDNSSNFTASANWSTGSSSGYYGTNYRFRSTQAISDAASWSVSLPSSGSYTVSAWWVAGTNRSSAAPYQVVHTGGTSTVNKNQQASGASWQTLGTYNFNSGTNTVRLSCWAAEGYVVIADAVRFVKQ